jgi:hypothetical protein
VGLCEAYERNIQSLGGICLPILAGEPSVEDYVPWLTAEAACLPKLFAGVNENFISVTVEGVLVMAGDSIDLAARQAFATYSVADISFLGVRCPKNCPRYHARLVALFWL